MGGLRPQWRLLPVFQQSDEFFVSVSGCREVSDLQLSRVTITMSPQGCSRSTQDSKARGRATQVEEKRMTLGDKHSRAD